MRVVVTGDRHWDDKWIIERMLTAMADVADRVDEDLVVIEGGARGADLIAQRWHEHGPEDDGIVHVTVEAEWDVHGHRAGPIRNRRMIDEYEPDVVLAFHDDLNESKGTKNCVAYAKEKRIPVYLVSRP